MIPPLDLQAAATELRHELTQVFSEFLDSGRYVLGTQVSSFEQEYAEYCRADHCVGVASGLDALHLALRAADVGSGDEVIVASNTYIATWLAVTHAGAKVVPVEPDPLSHNMDPTRIEAAITGRTKAVLATNLYGLPVEYDAIKRTTSAAGISFLVDNAQAAGAMFRGSPVGGLADLECHSFYPSKNLGALGEAGAVTTSNASFADKIRALRNYGSVVRYQHDVPGYNSRLDELQAGFLRVRLRHLDEWNARRRRIADIYLSQLTGIPGLLLPTEPAHASSAWHLFVVQVARRDAVLQRMADRGVGCLIHYPTPPHQSGAYRDNFTADQYPIARALANSVLSIPMGPHLSLQDANTVAETLADVVANHVDADASSESQRTAA